MGPVILSTRGTCGVPEFAGNTWVWLQYILGLRSLGIRSIWVDRLEIHDPADLLGTWRSLSYFIRRFEQLARDFGFADSYFIADEAGRRLAGMSEEELAAACDQAELLIAVSEVPPKNSPLWRVARRAYIDVDPASPRSGLPSSTWD